MKVQWLERRKDGGCSFKIDSGRYTWIESDLNVCLEKGSFHNRLTPKFTMCIPGEFL